MPGFGDRHGPVSVIGIHRFRRSGWSEFRNQRKHALAMADEAATEVIARLVVTRQRNDAVTLAPAPGQRGAGDAQNRTSVGRDHETIDRRRGGETRQRGPPTLRTLTSRPRATATVPPPNARETRSASTAEVLALSLRRGVTDLFELGLDRIHLRLRELNRGIGVIRGPDAVVGDPGVIAGPPAPLKPDCSTVHFEDSRKIFKSECV